MRVHDIGRDFTQRALQVATGEKARGNFEYFDPAIHVIDDTLAVFAVVLAHDQGNPVLPALLITGFGGGPLGTRKSARQQDVADTKGIRIDQFRAARTSYRAQ